MHYVYILKSLKDAKLYIGATSDLVKRLKMHNDQKVFSTQSRAPLKLVYYEAYLAKDDAFNREKSFKKYGQGLRRLKERLKSSLMV